MPFRIAAIADVHYGIGDIESCGGRQTAIADVLFLRAVKRINRFIKPDVTLLLGDMLDDGRNPRAEEERARLGEIVQMIESPVIAIPGNHDGDASDFYRVFPRPADVSDFGGARFVTFLDPEEPEHNARRTEADLARMETAREAYKGPIIAVQHVPLTPPGRSTSPYGFTNEDAAWKAFVSGGFTLSVSGHFHQGDDMVARRAGNAVVVPALCERPFPFMEILIEDERVSTRRHELAIPQELGLVDYHVHTPFAYCQENMDIALSRRLAKEFGLKSLAFAEHSGQLYFEAQTFWDATFMEKGINTTAGVQNRMLDYLEEAKKHCPPCMMGLEIDCDYSGNAVVKPADLAQAQIRLGSIHWLEEMQKPNPDLRRAGEEMLGRLARLLDGSIHILAHPDRIFKRANAHAPPEINCPLVELLRERGVAAEVNFHTQEPDTEFVRMCIESGVRLSLGSDAHNLYEVGELWPHLRLIEALGYSASDLQGILVDIQPPV